MYTKPSDFFKNCYLVSFHTSIWPGQANAVGEVTIGSADTDTCKGGFLLIDQKHLAAIRNLRAGFLIRVLERYALPFPLRGIYCLPRSVEEIITAKWQEYETEFNQLANEFAEKFLTYKEEWKPKLKNEYDESYYPTDVRSRFKTELLGFTIDTPTVETDPLYQAKKDKLLALIAEAETTAIQYLRSQIHEIVVSLSSQLRDGKRFQQRSIEKPMEWITRFKEHLNLNNDAELENELGKLSNILKGTDINKIRDDDDFRIKISTEIGLVAQTIKSLMVNNPGRSFTEK